MSLKDLFTKYDKEFMLVVILLYYIFPFFLVSRLTLDKVHYHLNTIDHIIPLVPFAIVIYLSVFVLVFLPYFIIKDKRYFYNVSLSYFFVMSLSYIIYLFFPVEIVGPDPGTGIFAWVVSIVYFIDHTTNAFPSLHVAMALLSSLICYRHNKKYWWFILWAVLISISIVFVKQHYFIDIIGGALVGLIGYLILIRILEKKKIKISKNRN